MELGEEQSFLANTDSSCFQTLITLSNPLRSIHVHLSLDCYVLFRLSVIPHIVFRRSHSHINCLNYSIMKPTTNSCWPVSGLPPCWSHRVRPPRHQPPCPR